MEINRWGFTDEELMLYQIVQTKDEDYINQIGRNLDEQKAALAEATKNENIGIVLLTNKLCNLCADLVDSYRLNNSRPLIVEIPDRHGDKGGDNSILRCIRDAVGIKF